VAQDPLIWEQHPDKTRCQPDGFARFFAQAIESRGALVATEAVTGEMIGSSRYYGYDSVAREVEIGWTFLARRYWGGTYNREMKQLMLDHAFQAVDRVLFLVAPSNYRSQRAVLKLGAVPDGSHVDSAGNISLRYYLSASAWRAKQPL
jgi:RimJ/RimL family protein N-acetyltransferase